MHNQKLAYKHGKSELDMYFAEPALNFEHYENLDVLQW